LLLAPGAVRAPAQGGAPRPTWQVGDTWTYQVTTPAARDQPVQLVDRVLRRFPLDRGYEMISLGFTVAVDADLGIFHFKRGETIETFSPPVRVFVWPLENGRRWEARSNATVMARGRGQDTIQVFRAFSVEREETVTVPAGAFLAYKVVERDEKGILREESWYAPSVKWYARRVLYTAQGREEARAELSAFALH
ncbi:MAG: hypothetical protein HYY85_12295, partial [Deltaproteobacteria bacterium]|nr:hypothetical protein [Deltaproteobacteria bacterium]